MQLHITEAIKTKVVNVTHHTGSKNSSNKINITADFLVIKTYDSLLPTKLTPTTPTHVVYWKLLAPPKDINYLKSHLSKPAARSYSLESLCYAWLR